MALTHYVIVRRDLTLGEVAANLVHAAGESSGGLATTDTIAIVKGARNEQRLQRLAAQLKAAAVEHTLIVETDGAHAGQLMAIGLKPSDDARLRNLLNDFHALKELDAC